MCTNVKSSNLASRLGSSIRAPEGLDVLLLMDRRCNGGVKVTEAANDVAPWTGVPGGALNPGGCRQGDEDDGLNLLKFRREDVVLEHDVEAISKSHFMFMMIELISCVHYICFHEENLILPTIFKHCHVKNTKTLSRNA